MKGGFRRVEGFLETSFVIERKHGLTLKGRQSL